MKYFIDEEFIEDGVTIDLISIGIVCEDGRELYLQSADFDPHMASQWVKDNVFGSLILCPHVIPQCTKDIYANRLAHGGWGGQCMFKGPYGDIIGAHADCPWRTRLQIKNEILAFMDIEKYGKPELIGFYSAYDHVTFCQIFGAMADLPQGFPMYTFDLQQYCDMLGTSQLPSQTEGKHHALCDAKHNKVIWEYLNDQLSTRALHILEKNEEKH